MKAFLLSALLLLPTALFAQGVTIGTGTAPDPSAVLDVTSTSKGMLPPRLTEAARLAMGTGSVPAPAPGLLVYQTNGTSPGFYYASSATTWVRLSDATTADSRYIQNQTAAAQTGGFQVSGAGSVGTTLTVGGAATLTGAVTTGSTVAAGGSVQVPAASAYTYAAAKTYTATYGAADFQLETITASGGTYNGGSKSFFSSGGTSSEEFLISNARAALHLPQGATLVSATITYFPIGGTFAIRSATLPAAGTFANPPAPTTLGSVALTTNNASSTYLAATITLPFGTVVDNTKAYYLYLGGSVDVIGVRLTYTITQAE